MLRVRMCWNQHADEQTVPLIGRDEENCRSNFYFIPYSLLPPCVTGDKLQLKSIRIALRERGSAEKVSIHSVETSESGVFLPLL